MHILRPFLVILLSVIHINIFHKTKVLKIILRCLTCINPNCIKSYDIKHNFVFFSIFYSFVKIIFENFRLINGHFKTIFGHFSAKYMFLKNEDLTVILRCLVCLTLNWIKSYDILLVNTFFFLPENALFQG